MQESIEKENVNPGGPKDKTFAADMSPLILRTREFLEAHSKEAVVHETGGFDIFSFALETGFTLERGKPEIILASDTAFELGHPATASQSVILLSSQPELVRHGRITCIGPDLDRMTEGERRPFGQVIMLSVKPGCMPNPFEIENAQYLTDRLAGYMVRSVPGRLWVRVGKSGKASGLTLKTVGQAIIAVYSNDFEEIENIEVVFVTSSVSDVKDLSLISTEAEILSGRHKKLVLGSDGEVECPDLNCDTCEEKPVCDNLRDIVIKRRKKK